MMCFSTMCHIILSTMRHSALRVIFFFLATYILFIFLFGIADVLNIDNRIHYLSHKRLGVETVLYYDISFDKTILETLQIVGFIIAFYVPFHILRSEQELSKKNIRLSNQPFISTVQHIVFEPYLKEPKFKFKNIGSGPALFIRISYVDSNPDKPENAIFHEREPHSYYLEAGGESESYRLDEPSFYNFVTKSDSRELVSDLVSKGSQSDARIELTGLIEKNIGEDFYIYVHMQSLLEEEIILKAKYNLQVRYRSSSNKRIEFALKRMEIEQIGGGISIE